MSDPIAEAIARLRARQGPQGDAAVSPHAEPSVQAVRMAEALLFAAAEPLDAETLAARLPAGTDIPATIARLQEKYAEAGVRISEVGGRWRFETAPDLAYLLAEIPRGTEKAVSGRPRNIVHYCLSPAGHPRRDRGNTRRLPYPRARSTCFSSSNG